MFIVYIIIKINYIIFECFLDGIIEMSQIPILFKVRVKLFVKCFNSIWRDEFVNTILCFNSNKICWSSASYIDPLSFEFPLFSTPFVHFIIFEFLECIFISRTWLQLDWLRFITCCVMHHIASWNISFFINFWYDIMRIHVSPTSSIVLVCFRHRSRLEAVFNSDIIHLNELW